MESQSQPSPEPDDHINGDSAGLIAAVDLGSNSFHMKVARMVDGQLSVIDRMRDPVRLAAGLNSRDKLRDKACRRALGTLEKSGQRLRNIPSENVRTVGTSTLPRARNGDAFLADAQAALGHPSKLFPGVKRRA